MENSLEDKRQKFLSLTSKGTKLYEAVCNDVQILQQTIVDKTDISTDQMTAIVNIMNQIHETLLKEANDDGSIIK